MDGLGRLMAAAGDLARSAPALGTFFEWPDAPMRQAIAPLAAPAVPLIEAMSIGTSDLTMPFVQAVKAAAPLAHWQHTYTEAEVGRDFLNRYGWFELLGPGGHFHSLTVRAYIAWWGEGLHYAEHLHEAEELYFVAAGEAEFHAEGQPSAIIGPEGTRLHLPSQPHAMDTHAQPVLALVLWRGAGLEGAARMKAA